MLCRFRNDLSASQKYVSDATVGSLLFQWLKNLSIYIYRRTAMKVELGSSIHIILHIFNYLENMNINNNKWLLNSGAIMLKFCC